MCVPIFILSKGCGMFHEPKIDYKVANGPAKFITFGTLSEAFVFITSLVIGILGLTGVIHMPPAAAYALIGVSGAIGLSYGSMIVLGKTIHRDKNGNFNSVISSMFTSILPKTIKIICANDATK